eukprot:239730-Pyramimonas_sp.AAC.1
MVGGARMVLGWLPVAWGRGCLWIGNSDKPLPEGEEKGVGRGSSLDHLRPEGWWDYSGDPCLGTPCLPP